MKKLFISQVMAGRSKEEIMDERAKCEKFAQLMNYEIEDSYITEECPLEGDNAGIWYLGKSLEHLANCNAILMCKGTENARGCQIEKAVAEKYNLKIYFIENQIEEDLNILRKLSEAEDAAIGKPVILSIVHIMTEYYVNYLNTKYTEISNNAK